MDRRAIETIGEVAAEGVAAGHRGIAKFWYVVDVPNAGSDRCGGAAPSADDRYVSPKSSTALSFVI
jgi:hypothetical protein